MEVELSLSSGFLGLLDQLGVSLVISSYENNQLIVLGKDIRYRAFKRPTGLAYADGKLAIGTQCGLWELNCLSGPNEVLFVPHKLHITGHIDLHEMAYTDHGLVMVNTAFSCLSELDLNYSFRPTWIPPWIQTWGEKDQCHLNGLAARNATPAFVTCLGKTNRCQDWRANKANGGILFDLAQNKILEKNLCMPHSPRWHQESLWFLESGLGAFCRWNKKKSTVSTFQGFTRGLAFADSVAFVGLSKARETATFGDLPITASQDLKCGVAAVDINTGETLEELKFEEGLSEISNLCLLPWPSVDILNDPFLQDEEQEKVLSDLLVLPEISLKRSKGFA